MDYKFFFGETNVELIHVVQDAMIFQMGFEFCVHDTKEPYKIALGRHKETAKQISGFPKSIDELISLQHLDCSFGVHNNSKRKSSVLPSASTLRNGKRRKYN